MTPKDRKFNGRNCLLHPNDVVRGMKQRQATMREGI